MRVLEIRPARVSAALVEIGDMLVSSPIGADGPRPARWLGTVTEHIIVEEVTNCRVTPEEWRQWRLLLVDGQPTETKPIPADGWVWVHLPSAPSKSMAEVMRDSAGETPESWGRAS